MRKSVGLIILIIISALFMMISCHTSSKVIGKEKKNFAHLYNPSTSRLHPVLQAYHTNDSVTELVIKLFPSELLFNKANPEAVMQAFVKLQYKLWEIDERGNYSVMVDSSERNYVIEKEDVSKRYYVNAFLKAKRESDYYLECEIQDNHRNVTATKFLYIEKSKFYGEQDFKVVFERNNQMAFAPYVIGNEPVRLYFSDSDVKSIFVKYYKDYQQKPPAVNILVVEPDIYSEYDSIYQISYGDYVLFEAQKKGMYLFQIDTSKLEGVVLVNFYEGYPKIEEPEQLIRPLTYLVSDVRYKSMLNESNKKLVGDNFWLDITNENTERARQLVRIYYSRVFFANYYFTSFKEGWMTDRGMVYILYGSPDVIHKEIKSEEWVYLGRNNEKKVTFNFKYKENAFSSNHYVLQRSDVANTYWREAFTSWNRGVVFSIDNQ